MEHFHSSQMIIGGVERVFEGLDVFLKDQPALPALEQREVRAVEITEFNSTLRPIKRLQVSANRRIAKRLFEKQHAALRAAARATFASLEVIGHRVTF